MELAASLGLEAAGVSWCLAHLGIDHDALVELRGAERAKGKSCLILSSLVFHSPHCVILPRGGLESEKLSDALVG